MLKSIQNFFKQPDIVQDDEQLKNELRLFCGIMIEAASVDGKIEKIEISKIKTTLTELFYENAKEVESVLSYCLTKVNEPNSLHFFTSKINKLFSNKKKINLLEILWEIVLIDGKIHDYESNLIRRLSGLMYISDVNCGNAKKRAQKTINNIQGEDL